MVVIFPPNVSMVSECSEADARLASVHDVSGMLNSIQECNFVVHIFPRHTIRT